MEYMTAKEAAENGDIPPVNNHYELRLYDKTLLKFELTSVPLVGNSTRILGKSEPAELLPLDLQLTGEGILKWLERRVIPKNRAFVDEILRSLRLARNNIKDIIDVCKGLSLNDSYWVVPLGFDGKYADFNLYENRF